MTDKLIKLLFAQKSCRAEVLHLEEAWQSMIAKQNLPGCVGQLLGEMTAAAVMLAAGLKFDGALVLQLQGDGPVKLALVEVRTGLITRATAQLRVPTDAVSSNASFTELVNASGNGRCALILDMAGRAVGEPPYQGVVSLSGHESVAAAVEEYLTLSEQVKSRLWLASSETACGGVLLQQVAATGGKEAAEIDPEGFAGLELLAQTVKPEEILGLSADEVAKRLFWEDNPAVLATLTPTFACRCSLSGVEHIVRGLGREEALSILKEKGAIEVRCEFCGSLYALDAVDVERLFADPAFRPAASPQSKN